MLLRTVFTLAALFSGCIHASKAGKGADKPAKLPKAQIKEFTAAVKAYTTGKAGAFDFDKWMPLRSQLPDQGVSDLDQFAVNQAPLEDFKRYIDLLLEHAAAKGDSADAMVKLREGKVLELGGRFQADVKEALEHVLEGFPADKKFSGKTNQDIFKAIAKENLYQYAKAMLDVKQADPAAMVKYVVPVQPILFWFINQPAIIPLLAPSAPAIPLYSTPGAKVGMKKVLASDPRTPLTLIQAEPDPVIKSIHAIRTSAAVALKDLQAVPVNLKLYAYCAAAHGHARLLEELLAEPTATDEQRKDAFETATIAATYHPKTSKALFKPLYQAFLRLWGLEALATTSLKAVQQKRPSLADEEYAGEVRALVEPLKTLPIQQETRPHTFHFSSLVYGYLTDLAMVQRTEKGQDKLLEPHLEVMSGLKDSSTAFSPNPDPTAQLAQHFPPITKDQVGKPRYPEYSTWQVVFIAGLATLIVAALIATGIYFMRKQRDY